MIHTDMPNKKIHQGRNIKRFREMLGIKQEALAFELGEDWNQKKISLLEQKESVEKDILEQVAKILKLPIEAIENFDEEQAVNVIANTYSFQDFKDNAVASGFSYQPSFNPIDKMVDLYERMLQQQKEMIEKLERLIEGK
ncbi:transcriptional regulator [Elizabethkingia anophelis]|nr:transcriptional regulator [Elizabethkingia anophelis]MDV3685040.1 transcriptional regulator [Elizabethkingia anophelis]MDV3782548.1 transcriptional regulator [Elizabethkingia anophelis]MDV3807908.1 transcriptional regulator [Elizabethkingia anophelis]MDV3816065.1 transcriptional regulator [Elizabethkingia anophelis]